MSARCEIEALARGGRLPGRADRRCAAALAGSGEVAHQGVIAEVEPLRAVDRRAICSRRSDRHAIPLLLALDGVQDPHNLGACLRTADACGVLAVVVPRDRAAAAQCDGAQGRRRRGRVHAGRHRDQSGAHAAAAEAGRAVGRRGRRRWRRSRPQEVDLTGRRVLVMGAGGHGAAPADAPQLRLAGASAEPGAVESLNVSVATGMLLYEALRQREATRQRRLN